MNTLQGWIHGPITEFYLIIEKTKPMPDPNQLKTGQTTWGGGHTIPSITSGWWFGWILHYETPISALRLEVLMHSDMTNSTKFCVLRMEKVCVK